MPPFFTSSTLSLAAKSTSRGGSSVSRSVVGSRRMAISKPSGAPARRQPPSPITLRSITFDSPQKPLGQNVAGMELPAGRLVLLAAGAGAQGGLPAGTELRLLRRRRQVVDELEREEVAALVDEHLEPVERRAGEALDERLADTG